LLEGCRRRQHLNGNLNVERVATGLGL